MRLRNVGHATFLLESRGVTVLTDPWLTPRLDRFWEHHPPLNAAAIPKRADVILLTHHHFDHCHLPSLHRLNRDAVVVYPETPKRPLLAQAGGGVLAVPWILKRLGFHNTHPIRSFEQLEVGDLTVSAVPSAVPFPEVTYIVEDGTSRVFFAADSMLHAETLAWLQATKPRFDLALVPVHSVSYDSCFRSRIPFRGREDEDQRRLRRRLAVKQFERYLDALQAGAVIPSAFGWRVLEEPVMDEPACGWINRKLFPVTVAEGYHLGHQWGHPMHAWQPGDEVELAGRGKLEGAGDHWDDIEHLEEVSRALEYDHGERERDFEPAKIGPPVSEEAHREVIDFVERQLIGHLIDTPLAMQSIDHGTRTRFRVTGEEDLSWVIDFSAGGGTVTRDGGVEAQREVWIAESTFSRLIRSEIPYAHTWAHWLSDTHMLDSLFNKPGFFIPYAESLLAEPARLSRYGE